MKKSLLLILLIFIIPLTHFAQPSAKTVKKIDTFIDEARADWNVPGVAVAIVQGKKLVYAKGFGLADVESGRAVNQNTVFAIGSSSKAFTAASVLQLVDDGLVELDKPVLDYLPDFRMHDDYVTNHMTVRDLLCHRSGLPRHDLVWYGSPDSRTEIFQKLKYLEPSAGFREVFQYQNLMYMTAGYLVGQMRNSTWEKEVQDRILNPLGMARANFSVAKMAEDPNHALPYFLQKDKLIKMDYRNIDAVGPAGSINASVTEMSRWLMVQLNGGLYNGESIISSGSIAQAHTSNMIVPGAWAGPLAIDNAGGPTTYGLGWFISTHKGHKTIQHGGNIDGYSAMVAMLPQDSIGVVVLTNLNGNPLPGIIRNYIFDLMLDEDPKDWNGDLLKIRADNLVRQDSATNGEDLKQVKGTSPSHKTAAYAGTYTHPAYGTMTVKAAGDSLDFSYNAIEVRLGHYHYDVFAATHPIFGPLKMAFHTDIDGNVESISAKLEPSVEDIRFMKEAEKMDMTGSANSLTS